MLPMRTELQRKRQLRQVEPTAEKEESDQEIQLGIIVLRNRFEGSRQKALVLGLKRVSGPLNQPRGAAFPAVLSLVLLPAISFPHINSLSHWRKGLALVVTESMTNIISWVRRAASSPKVQSKQCFRLSGVAFGLVPHGGVMGSWRWWVP